MKVGNTWFNFAAVIIILTVGICHAQTIALKPAPINVVVDGNDSEWGNTLPYTGDNGKVSYMLANDKNNLYLVLKTKDTVLQEDILGSGITFNVDIKGKKGITFPVNELEDESRYLGLSHLQTEIKTSLTKYRKINAVSFKVISDEQLTTANPYGINVAIGYDTNESLVYEEAIPLELLEKGAADKVWDFTIKINGLEKKGKAIFIEGGEGLKSSNYLVELAYHEELAKKNIDLINQVPNGIRKRMNNSMTSMPTLIRLTPPVEFSGKFMLVKK